MDAVIGKAEQKIEYLCSDEESMRIGALDMKIREEYTCPLEIVHDILKEK